MTPSRVGRVRDRRGWCGPKVVLTAAALLDSAAAGPLLHASCERRTSGVMPGAAGHAPRKVETERGHEHRQPRVADDNSHQL